MSRGYKKQIFCILATAALSGCHSVDIKNNIVWGRTYVPFQSIGDWDVYGVSGALQTRRFIKPQRVPSDYPFTDVSATGFGGVLLACTVNSEYVAYDLSCPVEHSQQTLVYVDSETNYAKCPRCGSVYDIFCLTTAPGYPIGGPAVEDGYGLTPYRVVFGADNCYALISQ
ncbi:MAG: hypothetical protein NC301_01110 [Bacteroides sp.]|nr:hypothetical protein [Bacteroides sp.]MCM1378788.1 hypothetical protein [Bacteroides sp.]MCM1445405.1 hypothetical protein [Prevotella sp.]